MNGHDDDRRKVIHATICAPAADELRAFCVGHGITVTAFLDGLGHTLKELQSASMEDLIENSPIVASSLLFARTIDAGRRNRERRTPPFSSDMAAARLAVPPGG